MGKNLKDRLARIKSSGSAKPTQQHSPASQGSSASQSSPAQPTSPQAIPATQAHLASPTASFGPEWSSSGYNVLVRQVKIELPLAVPKIFCDSIKVIIRDINKYGKTPKPQDLLFFDLETTGLSGGAGTLAFLASFGRFLSAGKTGGIILSINQYLLLDYPGESDFLEKAREELLKTGSHSSPQLIVSYNGKAFDSQIIKNRFLMNGIKAPDYFHADLLYPARKLWKRILPNCSQATVETLIPGLDREGDIPGAMAPDIWFSFLKSGNTKELMGICEHNILDIKGLACIILLMDRIAEAPLKTFKKISFDIENLALEWHNAVTRRRIIIDNMLNIQAMVKELLETAAHLKMPRALLLLAKDAEWKECDCKKALAYTESCLAVPGLNENLILDLERRRERLLRKLKVILK